jgi:ABC-type thiamin/hydroxymethylpyrimidine transport system permease subunit
MGFLSERLRDFSIMELVLIGLVAALGVATKPIVVPLVHIITGPLFIPGGAVAGGFYMLWIVLGAGIIRRRGAGSIIALTQALLVVVLGVYGTHGIVSILTYTLPGVGVDLVFLFSRNKEYTPLHYFLAGGVANLMGTLSVNWVFFQLPLVPLLLSLCVALLSGGLGGLIAFQVAKRFVAMQLLKQDRG